MNGLEIVWAIVVINIVYVSLFTLRIIWVMKSQQLLASLLSMMSCASKAAALLAGMPTGVTAGVWS
ncbi:hypothetical protein [Xylanibacillus composti]|uniref:Uncharacterized protein n=1 Tax=Xylanibacillus composti TaxID=1572762 RepID=A0A8J4H0U0_9BACL|nr:hypothetical protein XYCOK13_03250 [Xylanibacillus composti]